MNRTSAFTLVEILVGITVIGLIFSFGYVSFRDFARRQSLVGASKLIKGDLRLAQAMALSGEKPEGCSGLLDGYTFKKSSGGSGGYDYVLEAKCGANSYVTKSVDLPSDVSISNFNPILFKVLGNGTDIQSGQSVTITLTQVVTGSQAQIDVTYAGEIK